MLDREQAAVGVGERTRRRTRVVVIVLLVSGAALLAINEIVSRSRIQYESAEELFADMRRGGFECENVFFPKGRNEPTDISSAECERGSASVHLIVNTERGRPLIDDDDYEPLEPPYWPVDEEAILAGPNWSVNFGATDRDAVELALEIREAVGGELFHSGPRPD